MSGRGRLVRRPSTAPKHARRAAAEPTARPVTAATASVPAPAFEALSGPIAAFGTGGGHDDTITSGGSSWRR